MPTSRTTPWPALVVELGGQNLARPPAEAVQVHAAAVERHPFDRHLRDPAQADEDMPPLQGHDESERARRFALRGLQDHHVPDAPDGQAVGAEQPPPGKT